MESQPCGIRTKQFDFFSVSIYIYTYGYDTEHEQSKLKLLTARVLVAKGTAFLLLNFISS